MNRGLRLAITLLALVCGGAALAQARAAAPGLIPVEDFVRRPKLERLAFSPDGKKFAALEERKGRMNIVVADLAQASYQSVTDFEATDVVAFRWISDKRLVFTLGDYQSGLADQRAGGLIAVDADGKDGKRLAPTLKECIDSLRLACRYTAYWGRVPGSDDDIIAVTNERSADSPDLVRLDTRSGRRSLITSDNPGQVRSWALDAGLVPRAALSEDRRSGQRTFWYRDDAKSPWRKTPAGSEWQPGFEPLDFGPDGTLYVASSLASKDKKAIHRFDPATGLPGEKIAAHPLFDLGLIEDRRTPGRLVSPLLFDSRTGALAGLQIDGDQPETVWFEEKFARLQATMDKAFPAGNVNTLTPVTQERTLVLSRSGSDPGAYYVHDASKGELRELLRPRAWIDPARMGTVKVWRYAARDGLQIPAYLTLPSGTPARPAKPLPLVAWIHGGPWARDDYGFDTVVQFLASRGYAVLQPNYRGSTGFGLKHFSASFKQLGQAMQDDITDGIRQLVADGVVDPKRVCIGGASYGGYAALMGLVREPELFRCGVSVVGVTDLVWWQELGYTDFNLVDAEAASTWLKRTVGDPTTDRAMMEANSPRLQAGSIKAPVLFVHGGGDVRVPLRHAEAMRDALKAKGAAPQWLVFPEEGHGFMKESNRAEYFRRLEAFLGLYLAP